MRLSPSEQKAEKTNQTTRFGQCDDCTILALVQERDDQYITLRNFLGLSELWLFCLNENIAQGSKAFDTSRKFWMART